MRRFLRIALPLLLLALVFSLMACGDKTPHTPDASGEVTEGQTN